jgi:hypothetical protein
MRVQHINSEFSLNGWSGQHASGGRAALGLTPARARRPLVVDAVEFSVSGGSERPRVHWLSAYVACLTDDLVREKMRDGLGASLTPEDALLWKLSIDIL